MSTATPFVFFSIMTLVQFFVVLFVYPETKGATLEELQRRLLRPGHVTSARDPLPR